MKFLFGVLGLLMVGALTYAQSAATTAAGVPDDKVLEPISHGEVAKQPVKPLKIVVDSESQPETYNQIASQISKLEKEGEAQGASVSPKHEHWVRMTTGIDFLIFGGIYREKLKPTFATSISSVVEFKHVPGRIEITLYPHALLAVGEARSDVKESRPFIEAYKSSARAYLAKLAGISPGMVSAVFTPAQIAATEGKVRDVANLAVDQQINYTAAFKTALNRIVYVVDLTDRLEASVGKDYSDATRDLVPDASVLIFGSSPEVKLKYRGDFIVSSLRVYHARTFVSPFDVAQAYVKAVLQNGGDFFSLNPDSYEFSEGLTEQALTKLGLKMVKSLIVGAGQTNHNAFGYVRLDVDPTKNLKLRTIWNWEDGTNQVARRYWGDARYKMAGGKVALGSEAAKVAGTSGLNFYKVQPFFDVQVFNHGQSRYFLRTMYEYAKGPGVVPYVSHGEIERGVTVEIYRNKRFDK